MRIIRRLSAGTFAVLAVTAAGAVTGTTVAQAHETCVVSNYGFACVGAGHHKVTVADSRTCDGHEVRASVVFANGTTTNVFDPDGCGAANGVKTFERTIVRYRLCGDGIGCSPWSPT